MCAGNIAEVRQLARERFGRNPSNLKVLALVTPILGRTEEEAVDKVKGYRRYASHEGALALFAGWVSSFGIQCYTPSHPGRLHPSVARVYLKVATWCTSSYEAGYGHRPMSFPPANDSNSNEFDD